MRAGGRYEGQGQINQIPVFKMLFPIRYLLLLLLLLLLSLLLLSLFQVGTK